VRVFDRPHKRLFRSLRVETGGRVLESYARPYPTWRLGGSSPTVEGHRISGCLDDGRDGSTMEAPNVPRRIVGETPEILSQLH